MKKKQQPTYLIYLQGNQICCVPLLLEQSEFGKQYKVIITCLNDPIEMIVQTKQINFEIKQAISALKFVTVALYWALQYRATNLSRITRHESP